MCYFYTCISKSVVLNLVVGTETHKFHMRITEPFVIGKIKYNFFEFKYRYVLLVHKMNHASVAHQITV